MKLISSILYEKIMNSIAEKDMVPNEPTSFLNANTPDELKLKFYHEAKRNEHAHNQIVQNKPLLVKNVDEERDSKPEPEVKAEPPLEIPIIEEEKPRRITQGDRIANFLKSCEIKRSRDNEIVYQGKVLPNSNYDIALSQLMNAKKKRSSYTNKIIEILQDYDVPRGTFTPGIYNLMKSPKRQNQFRISKSLIPWKSLP